MGDPLTISFKTKGTLRAAVRKTAVMIRVIFGQRLTFWGSKLIFIVFSKNILYPSMLDCCLVYSGITIFARAERASTIHSPPDQPTCLGELFEFDALG